MSQYEQGDDWYDDNNDTSSQHAYNEGHDSYGGEDGYRFTLVNGQVTNLQEFDDGFWQGKQINPNESWRFDGASLVKEELKPYGIEISIYTDSNGDGIFSKVSEIYGYKTGSFDGASFQLTSSGDRWEGSESGEHVYAGDGDDLITGGYGNDILEGGPGGDYLYGDQGDDLVNGGLGNDFLYGGEGDDELIGSAGGDWLIGEFGANTVRAGLNDGAVDSIVINPDSAFNPLENPDGAKRDLLLDLDPFDVIIMNGVNDESLAYVRGVVDPLGTEKSGVGIYVNGVLEALVVGSFTAEQVNNMTTGLV